MLDSFSGNIWIWVELQENYLYVAREPEELMCSVSKSIWGYFLHNGALEHVFNQRVNPSVTVTKNRYHQKTVGISTDVLRNSQQTILLEGWLLWTICLARKSCVLLWFSVTLDFASSAINTIVFFMELHSKVSNNIVDQHRETLH